MAKIGTAHVEIKPVIDMPTLEAITERIAEAVAEGVRRGMEPTWLPGTHEPECNDKCSPTTGEHHLLGE